MIYYTIGIFVEGTKVKGIPGRKFIRYQRECINNQPNYIVVESYDEGFPIELRLHHKNKTLNEFARTEGLDRLLRTFEAEL